MKPPHPLESRYASRWVGSFVIIAIALLLFGLSQSGTVERWLNPMQEVRVLLPQEGLFGLSEGSNVEVLGTKVGYVKQIIIDPEQQIYADVLIRRDALGFIRTDSTAVIRKRFGVAGDSYLEITRGYREELDWEFAVIEADADRAPTDLLQTTIDEIRGQVVPTLEEARRALAAFADIGEQLNDPEGELALTLQAVERISVSLSEGEGLVGRLINDPDFADRFVSMIERLDSDLARLEPLLGSLRATASNVQDITAALGEQTDEIPQVTERLGETLASLQTILADVKDASPRLPEITDNLASTTDDLPYLIAQTRSTLYELEQLTRQLQGNWLLGGRGAAGQDNAELDPLEAAP
ncbi:MAG: MlaD family protein [Planctomycetota bacterium]